MLNWILLFLLFVCVYNFMSFFRSSQPHFYHFFFKKKCKLSHVLREQTEYFKKILIAYDINSNLRGWIDFHFSF